ncbi:hypothetical protein F4777DRAFT_152768 [Nemania sp. FL0916]|nr:hypothetical protein F4777DRAFT_152768 [Nemania sp. FL0916]
MALGFVLRMAELGRTAQVAVRSASASLLRTALTTRSRLLCPHVRLAGALSSKHKNYISTTASAKSDFGPFNWTKPGGRAPRSNDNRTGGGGIADISSIRKPQSKAYNLAYGGHDNVAGGTTAGEHPGDGHAKANLDLDIGDISNTKPAQHENKAPKAPKVSLRLVPRTGRTVFVRHNVDVAKAFGQLSKSVAFNRIPQQLREQRFHERPGMKRKRLRSERWQKKFTQGFKATVSRVRYLTRQGW